MPSVGPSGQNNIGYSCIFAKWSGPRQFMFFGMLNDYWAMGQAQSSIATPTSAYQAGDLPQLFWPETFAYQAQSYRIPNTIGLCPYGTMRYKGRNVTSNTAPYIFQELRPKTGTDYITGYRFPGYGGTMFGISAFLTNYPEYDTGTFQELYIDPRFDPPEKTIDISMQYHIYSATPSSNGTLFGRAFSSKPRINDTIKSPQVYSEANPQINPDNFKATRVLDWVIRDSITLDTAGY